MNQHWRKPDFGVGDKAWLNARNLRSESPSKKLDHQSIGPYLIKRKIGWSYELELPENLKNIHPVFHAKLLCKDPANPVPGQSFSDPEEIHVVPGEQRFAVDSIRAVKLVRRQLQYRAN